MIIPKNLQEGTKLFKAWEVLSDGNWHCAKCELPGTQPAALMRELQQRGYPTEKKTMPCRKCGDSNTHRKLK